MAQSGSDSTYIPSSRPSSTALVRAADPNRVAHFVEDSTGSAVVVAMEEQRKLRGCVVGKVRDRHANERDQNPLSDCFLTGLARIRRERGHEQKAISE